MGRGREAVVSVAPELTVEPLVTYYRRRAQGSAFVRHVLESRGPLNTMRRLTAQGPATRSLDEERYSQKRMSHGCSTATSFARTVTRYKTRAEILRHL